MRTGTLVLLFLLAALPVRAASPGMAGSWYDSERGLWLVLEPTGTGYRTTVVLLDRWPDGRLVNRFDGLALPCKLLRGTLGFGGEGKPAGDALGRRWRIEGSVRMAPALDRLDGAIRVESAPYVEPPHPSQRLELHRLEGAPTLSVLTANRPAKPKRQMPVAESERAVAVAVGIQYLPQKTDVEQGLATPGYDVDPRHHALTSRVQGWWRFDRDAAW